MNTLIALAAAELLLKISILLGVTMVIVMFSLDACTPDVEIDEDDQERE